MSSIIYLLVFSLWGQNFDRSEWQEWKNDYYKNALESPTSFLNATSLDSVETGTIYLVEGVDRNSTKWVKKEPAKFKALAEHQGDRVRVKIGAQSSKYLTPKKRRMKIPLKNGAIGEAVFGRRNGKLWGYIYNPDQIKKFSGFRYYPFNSQAVVTGHFKSHPRKFISYKTVQGDPTQVSKVGTMSFMLNGQELYLNAYNWQKAGEPLRYLALIYTDETAGYETYGGGREVIVELTEAPRDGQAMTIDFNRTVNFYCAHSPFWHCPVGLQQHIKTKVKAGEMLPLKKISSH